VCCGIGGEPSIVRIPGGPIDETEDGGVCRGTQRKRSLPRHPPKRTTGWGVGGEEKTHREEGADVYTTPGPVLDINVPSPETVSLAFNGRPNTSKKGLWHR